MGVAALHPIGGFIEVVPLALTGIDFIWFIIGLAGFVVLAAGWSIYSPLFDVLSNISIFGIKPFGFITSLLQASMQKLAAVLMTRLSPLAHWLWALAQMVWRPLYVTLETLSGLMQQITGVSQGSQSGLAQLRAQEQADIAAVSAHEQASVTALENRMALLRSQLTTLVGQDIAAVNAHEQASVTALENRIANLSTSLTGTINRDIAGVDATLKSDVLNLNNRITSVQTSLQNTIANDVNALNRSIASGVSTAESFATGLVGGLGVGSITSTVTSLANRLTAVEKDVTECLDPLCDTVTPNAQRAGRNLNWLKNLESLGVEALIIALAAECLTNPAAVANDIHAVVNDVGEPILTGFKDLIGA